MKTGYKASYKELQVLGRGAYGVAYLVSSLGNSSHFYVAKKMMLHAMKDKEKQQAHQEIEILERLKSLFIVEYVDSFLEEDELIIIMEYCEEGDLSFFIKNRRKRDELISEKIIVNWFVQLALGIKTIHNNKILHRDIKSCNIFLTSNGSIKIGDFGISKVLQTAHEAASTLVGTPYYLSPEACENKPYGYKSDIWALGCVLYELCTLNYAFQANNLAGLVYKILTNQVERIPAVYSDVLADLVARLLNKSEQLRPSIDEILQNDFIKKEMYEFIKGEGKLPIYIPVKGTNLHETIKNEQHHESPCLLATESDEATMPLSYSQNLETMKTTTNASTKKEKEEQKEEAQMTPKQLLAKKKEEEILRKQEQLKQATRESFAVIQEAKQRKIEHLQESLLQKNKPKQKQVQSEEINKAVDSMPFKKKIQEQIPVVPHTSSPTRPVPTSTFEDRPLPTTLKKQQKKEQQQQLSQYFNQKFEEYEEDEVRITSRAPESQRKRISVMYEEELKSCHIHCPSPVKKQEAVSQEKGYRSVMGRLVSECESSIGEKEFKSIYAFMKERKRKQVSDKDIYNELIGKYGKQYKKHLEDIEQVIYLESIEALSAK